VKQKLRVNVDETTIVRTASVAAFVVAHLTSTVKAVSCYTRVDASCIFIVRSYATKFIIKVIKSHRSHAKKFSRMLTGCRCVDPLH